MEKGDFIKGTSGNSYSITNEKMTKGVVTEVISSESIKVKILEHTDGRTGAFEVESSKFEVIGHVKGFNREEVLELLTKGCKKAVLDYDLSGADLSDADLRSANLRSADLSSADLRSANLSDADLSGADLSDADLRSANLRSANLRSANLSGANLRSADLRSADLSDADLRSADLDFSCMPLKCGGLRWKIDKRIACQLAYHLCSMQCEDEEYIKMRNSILAFANQFHRVDECGHLDPVGE